MVQVAAGRGPRAARCGAPAVASPDQVGQLAAGVVADLGMGVVAGAANDREQRGSQAGQVGRGMSAGQTGVGGGGAVGVQRGNAPPGAGVASRGGGQVAGLVAVQHAEPVGLAG